VLHRPGQACCAVRVGLKARWRGGGGSLRRLRRRRREDTMTTRKSEMGWRQERTTVSEGNCRSDRNGGCLSMTYGLLCWFMLYSCRKSYCSVLLLLSFVSFSWWLEFKYQKVLAPSLNALSFLPPEPAARRKREGAQLAVFFFFFFLLPAFHRIATTEFGYEAARWLPVASCMAILIGAFIIMHIYRPR
jgi:hypothetical protein